MRKYGRQASNRALGIDMTTPTYLDDICLIGDVAGIAVLEELSDGKDGPSASGCLAPQRSMKLNRLQHSLHTSALHALDRSNKQQLPAASAALWLQVLSLS